MVRVRYWAGARQAAGLEEEPVALTRLGEVRGELGHRHGQRLVRILDVSLLLLDGVAVEHSDRLELPGDSVLEILPPFAGG